MGKKKKLSKFYDDFVCERAAAETDALLEGFIFGEESGPDTFGDGGIMEAVMNPDYDSIRKKAIGVGRAMSGGGYDYDSGYQRPSRHEPAPGYRSILGTEERYRTQIAEIFDTADLSKLPEEWQALLTELAISIRDNSPIPDIPVVVNSPAGAEPAEDFSIRVHRNDGCCRLFVDDGWIATPCNIQFAKSTKFVDGALDAYAEEDYNFLLQLQKINIFLTKHPTAIYTKEEFVSRFAGISAFSAKYRFLKIHLDDEDKDYVFAYLVGDFDGAFSEAIAAYDLQTREDVVSFLHTVWLACNTGNNCFAFDDGITIEDTKEARMNIDAFHKMVADDGETVWGTSDPDPLNSMRVPDIHKLYNALDENYSKILFDEEPGIDVDDDDEFDTEEGDESIEEVDPTNLDLGTGDNNMVAPVFYRQ